MSTLCERMAAKVTKQVKGEKKDYWFQDKPKPCKMK